MILHLSLEVVEINVRLPELRICKSVPILASHVASHVHQPVENLVCNLGV